MVKMTEQLTEAVLTYVNSLLSENDQCRDLEDLSTGIAFMGILKLA